MPKVAVRWRRRGFRGGSVRRLPQVRLIAECRRRFEFYGVLPSIHVPTLVIADAEGGGLLVPENARVRRAACPQCRVGRATPWECRGSRGTTVLIRSLLKWGGFISNLREHQATFDRLLATVLFTDIVDSTAQAMAIGDRDGARFASGTTRLFAASSRSFEDARSRRWATASWQPSTDHARRALRTGDHAEHRGTRSRDPRRAAHRRGGARRGRCFRGRRRHRSPRRRARQPSEVLVSQTIKDLTTGSGIVFTDRGEYQLKGIPDTWHLYQAKS